MQRNQSSSYSLESLIENYSIFEIVFISTFSVSIGVAYWGWTFFYEVTKPILKLVGLGYLSSGFWIFIGIFIPLIVRRPFAAIIASVIAAGVEGFMTHWGLMALLWGFVQGFGAEAVFALFKYRRWDYKILFLAAFVSTTLSYSLDYYFYKYDQLSTQLNITQSISFILSAFVFAVYLSIILVQRLNKMNLLNRFLIAKK